MEGPFERSTKTSSNLHAAAAARARWWFMVRGVRIGVVIRAAIRRRRRHIEQDSAKRELFCAVAIGKHPVITNAVEAVRQNVEEEAAYKFTRLKPHDFALVTAAHPIIVAMEADVAFIHTEQPTVGDRDAMRVPRKIGEDMLGTGEGMFRVNDPAGSAQWRQSGGEHLRIVEARDSGKEAQFSSVERCSEGFEK